MGGFSELRESYHVPWHTKGGGSGVLALDPFPLGDLLGGRHLTAHVMTALHGNGELLVFHVGTDVVNLGDLTSEGGPGTTDVEVSGFVHAVIIGTGSGASWVRVDTPSTVTPGSGRPGSLLQSGQSWSES